MWFAPTHWPQYLSLGPTTMFATLVVHQNTNWYMDSGVNHNLTTNNSNMANPAPYAGHEAVMLGNCNSASISRIKART